MMRRRTIILFASFMLACQASEPTAPPGMVLIPAGALHMPFRTETSPKTVAIKPFWLDVLPVTNAEFLEFLRANPTFQRSQIKRKLADERYLSTWSGDLDPGKNSLRAPVTEISWYVAKAYCAWKNKRLPTTAEWEYTAAASPTRPDGANDAEFQRQILAWYSSPALEKLPDVGGGVVNFYGARNLHNLVWEWVSDFDTQAGGAAGDDALKDAFCGGGSKNAADPSNFPAFMRFGLRSSLQSNYTLRNLSFRCAKDL